MNADTWPRVKEVFHAALERDVKDRPAYIAAACANDPGLGPLQNPRKFLDITEAGVAAVPSSTLILNFHGYALLDDGQYPEAVRVFESYARLAPREPNPYDSLGETHIKMGLPEKAIEYFSKALTIHPTFFPSHVGRAWALSMLGRYDEAIAENPTFAFLKGFMLSRVGRYREADQMIAFDISRVEANKNVVEHGMLQLVSTVLALERRQPALVAAKLRTPEQLFTRIALERQRVHVVLAHTIAGLADVQAGRLDAARLRLDVQRRVVDRDVAPQYWWHKLLEGEIALAAGDPQKAAAAYAAGEPEGKMWLHLNTTPLTLLANNLLFRDGVARAAKARGDLKGAIGHYRRLLSVGPDQKWTAMYEPRYVLEIARLLEQSGERTEARKEYLRFLEFWKNADSDLPELAEANRAVARLR